MLWHMLCQILLYGRHTRLAHFHQLHAAVFQFCGRLHEIAAIGPQTGPVLLDQGNAGGTGKAGDVFSAREMLAHVLGLVEVRGRHQVSIHMISLHQAAETRNSFCDLVHVVVLVFIL